MSLKTKTTAKNFDALLSVIERPVLKENCEEDKDSNPESKLKEDWEAEKHRLIKTRYSKDTLIRVILACSTQGIIVGWLVCALIILMGECHHTLSDSVLITLLATTTTTVIGLALIVLKGFFQFMKQDVDLDK